jgi:hypothetical protein
MFACQPRWYKKTVSWQRIFSGQKQKAQPNGGFEKNQAVVFHFCGGLIKCALFTKYGGN